MKTETRRVATETSTGWALQVFEQTWAGIEGSMWRGELANPEGRVVHAPKLQTSVETILESVVSFLSAANLRHTGIVLAEMARAEMR